MDRAQLPNAKRIGLFIGCGALKVPVFGEGKFEWTYTLYRIIKNYSLCALPRSVSTTVIKARREATRYHAASFP